MAALVFDESSVKRIGNVYKTSLMQEFDMKAMGYDRNQIIEMIKEKVKQNLLKNAEEFIETTVEEENGTVTISSKMLVIDIENENRIRENKAKSINYECGNSL